MLQKFPLNIFSLNLFYLDNRLLHQQQSKKIRLQIHHRDYRWKQDRQCENSI